MNKQETIQIITLLAGNYNNISEKNTDQKKIMLATWHECLKDLDYNLVLLATKKAIIDSPYPPTIYDIRLKATELMNTTTKKSGIEAWQEAYKMICNGSYMTKEDFEKHSEEVKKFFGSTENLRSYSTNTDFNIDVVRSNFLKQYEIIVAKEKEERMLPPDMQKKLNILSNRVGIINNEEKCCRKEI